MKKITLLFLVLIGVKVSAQVDSITNAAYTTAPGTSYYGLMFNETPSKQMFRINVDYIVPWVYTSGLMRPRYTTSKVSIGKTTNSGFQFEVEGKGYFSQGIEVPADIKLQISPYTDISATGNEMYLYSAAAGLQSLSALALGGSGSVSPTATLKLTPPATDTGLYVTTTTGYGVRVANSGGGYGYYGSNSSSGNGYFANNTSSGNGMQILNSSVGTGLHIVQTGSKNALVIAAGTDTVLSVTGDSLYFKYLKGSATGSRFPVLTVSGALDSGTLTNASAQLLLKYPSIRAYMKDTQDGELAGYYTKDDELVKNYGLKDNKTGQSLGLEVIEILQGHAERNYIFNLRNWIENKWQWVGMVVLLLWVIRLEIKLRKK